MPIMKNDVFMGALEIYYDISEQINIIDDTLIICNAMSIGFLLAFFILCLIVIRKLDANILERQAAREYFETTSNRLTKAINQRIGVENEREKLIKELQASLEKIKVLSGLVPICSYCNNIRNDSGYWEQMEEYIEKYSDAEFSHGLCPGCAEKHYSDFYKPEDDAPFGKKVTDLRGQKETNKPNEFKH